jgi:hypothetical protein
MSKHFKVALIVTYNPVEVELSSLSGKTAEDTRVIHEAALEALGISREHIGLIETADLQEVYKDTLINCPFCGTQDVEVAHPPLGLEWQVECHNHECTTVGPSKPTREAAVAAWNSAEDKR